MNRYLLFSLIFLFFYKSDAQTEVLKQIKVKGNNFINSDDKVVIFRGLNTSNPDNLMKNEHWNKAYF